MKNRIFIAAAAAVLVLGSCTDLEVDIKSKYTEFPENDIAKQAVAANCFTSLRSCWGAWYTGFLMVQSTSGGENLGIALGTDWYDGGTRMRVTLHNVTPNDGTMSNAYSNLQSAITKCNKALNDLDMMEENPPSALCAQIRAMRAYYTWMLMDNFGDTPILDHMVTDEEEVVREDRGKVADWLMTELKAILDYLPVNMDASTYGKPTRYMADALLAKLYLNWPVYTASDVTAYDASGYVKGGSIQSVKLNECIAVCDDIIKSGKFELGSDYKTKFYPDNGPSTPDFIYTMTHSGPDYTENQYGRYHVWRRAGDDNNPDGSGPGLWYEKLSMECGGCFTMNPDFAKLFCLSGDRRNDCIYGNDKIDGYPEGQVFRFGSDYEKDYTDPCYFWENGEKKPVVATRTVTLAPIKNDNGEIVPLGPAYDHLSVENNLSGWLQGWRGMKYPFIANEFNSYHWSQSNDQPILRFADVLLMKAEAITRGGAATEGDTPMSLFNQVRKASNAPELTAEPSLQDLLDERGRELFEEGWRRNDMIRFGQYETPGWDIAIINPDVTDKRMRIFPIPTSVLNSNTNWTQNPGY